MLTRTVRLVKKPDRRPELREGIRQDFTRLPGLAVTLDEASGFWNLERSTCRHLLDSLVDERFLEVDEGARYCRAGDGTAAARVQPGVSGSQLSL